MEASDPTGGQGCLQGIGRDEQPATRERELSMSVHVLRPPTMDDASFAGRRDRSARRVEILLIIGFALLYVWFVLRTAVVIEGRSTFTLFDDAMISMRYGRNLARGNGLVFNAGQPVEGYTNLLWTLVMAGVHTVVRDDRRTALVVSMIGVGILSGQQVLVRSMLRRVTDAVWAPGLGILVVGSSFAMVFWTLRGMEVGLVALLVLGAVAVTHCTPEWTLRRRAVVVGALLAAAVFTRDDALVLAVVVVANLALTVPTDARRHAAATAASGLVALVATRLAVRWWMYGEFLPNTYDLKVGGIPKTLLVERGVSALVLTASFGLGVGLALGVVAVRKSALARTCLAVVGAQVLYSTAVGGDAWEYFGFPNRFVATVIPPLAVAAVIGVVALHRGEVSERVRAVGLGVLALSATFVVAAPSNSTLFALGHGGPPEVVVRLILFVLAAVGLLLVRRRQGVLALAVALVLAGNVLPLWSWASDGEQIQRIGDRWAAEGVVLREATPEDAVIAATGIGNLGYFSDRPLVDLLGKVDPVIAHTPPRLDDDIQIVPGHTKWDLRHSVGQLRPDLVVQLYWGTAADAGYLRSSGYRQVGTVMWVREDAAIADPAALRRAGELVEDQIADN